MQAGVGGDDAMDWAGMLARMYTQWFAAKGWDVVCVDRSPGELAGVKSVDFEVHGAYAYGLLSAEKGTHRLIRQSPFNSKGMRQTSFAAVDVVPLIDEARTLCPTYSIVLLLLLLLLHPSLLLLRRLHVRSL